MQGRVVDAGQGLAAHDPIPLAHQHPQDPAGDLGGDQRVAVGQGRDGAMNLDGVLKLAYLGRRAPDLLAAARLRPGLTVRWLLATTAERRQNGQRGNCRAARAQF